MERAETKQVDLATILRDYLRAALEKDFGHVQGADGGYPLPLWPLGRLETALDDTRAALADRDPRNVRHIVDSLMRQYELPEDVRHRLGIGVLEAEIRRLQEAIKSVKGEEPLVLDTESVVTAAPEAGSSEKPSGAEPKPAASQPRTPSTPLASTLIEPFLAKRRERDGLSHHDVSQEGTTFRLFLEVCGDRPVDGYGRGDITGFHETIRQLPRHYGKSPKDRDRSVADLIAEADAKGEERRLSDKTIKRHHTALSQFFRYAMDRGHLSNAARCELVEDHRFGSARNARVQRDHWTSDELVALFSSPLWTGCHPHFRSRPGPEVVRDARFWLPLLALYHGARLEEFADLYRRDIWQDEGTWAIRLVETDERSLKNDTAARILPLHPELIRMGFLSYIEAIAPQPSDPLFPDLEPQGMDRKRGPRITRWFVHYRKSIGVFREGVAMHSFRHTAITRLTDAITNEKQRRHRDFMMGHSSGARSEGDVRYDKGPGLKAAAETLALLSYPELDLRHLYVDG